MASAAERLRYTPEQYLALEREATYKSQLRDGFIYAMAGASTAHNVISMNLGGSLMQQLRGQPCRVVGSDMRIAVVPAGTYTYADVVVFCGEPRYVDRRLETLVNPTVLVEVLSPSTEADDRGRKFADYRRLESLREYVLVAQDRPRVERFSRRGEEWVLTEINGLDGVLGLPAIGCEVPLADIYDKVPLPAEGGPPEIGGEPGMAPPVNP